MQSMSSTTYGASKYTYISPVGYLLEKSKHRRQFNKMLLPVVNRKFSVVKLKSVRFS